MNTILQNLFQANSQNDVADQIRNVAEAAQASHPEITLENFVAAAATFNLHPAVATRIWVYTANVIRERGC